GARAAGRARSARRPGLSARRRQHAAAIRDRRRGQRRERRPRAPLRLRIPLGDRRLGRRHRDRAGRDGRGLRRRAVAPPRPLAGQVIVGRMLGAGEAAGAREAAGRMIAWGVGIGAAFAVVLLALGPWLPYAFTGDAAVVDEARRIWPLLALMQPLGGAVFAL